MSSMGVRYACSSLVFEEMTPGTPSAFFSNSGEMDSSLGKVYAGIQMITVINTDCLKFVIRVDQIKKMLCEPLLLVLILS